MPETFLNKAQLTGLSKDARRTEILRAKAAAAVGTTQAGKTNAATNGSGEIFVTFPTAYSTAPVVVATPADLIGSVGHYAMVEDETTTGFTIVLYYNDAKWLDPQVVPVNWIAFGDR